MQQSKAQISEGESILRMCPCSKYKYDLENLSEINLQYFIAISDILLKHIVCAFKIQNVPFLLFIHFDSYAHLIKIFFRNFSQSKKLSFSN
jgi:hypothetical protein